MSLCPADMRKRVRHPAGGCVFDRRCACAEDPSTTGLSRQPKMSRFGVEGARLDPTFRLDPRSLRCPAPLPEARNRGYYYPSGGRVRALQAILGPRIPRNRPPKAQNRCESGFPASAGVRPPRRLENRLLADSHGPCRFTARSAGRLVGMVALHGRSEVATVERELNWVVKTGEDGWSH